MSQFEPHTVGSSLHKEFWIPAAEVPKLNTSLAGLIATKEAFFGEDFKGWIPDKFGLKGKNAVEQFVAMFKTWEYSRLDFVLEMSANRKLFYMNFLFWCQFDFTSVGMNERQKRDTMENLKLVWDRCPEIPLPGKIQHER